MRRAVAILETMWDWRGMTSGAGYREAPRFFRINPKNFSGKRLYWFIGPDAKLLVTNACRELVHGPNDHGKGDPVWLRENLTLIEAGGEERLNPNPIEVLLICGRIAQDTFDRSGYKPAGARIIRLPHPAARKWTRESLDATAQIIQVKTGDWSIKVARDSFTYTQDTAIAEAALLLAERGGQ